MRNQKGKKIGLHMLTTALFFVLAMSVCTVKTEAKDYKQGKVYKITAKSKPLQNLPYTIKKQGCILPFVPIWRNSRKKEKERLF